MQISTLVIQPVTSIQPMNKQSNNNKNNNDNNKDKKETKKENNFKETLDKAMNR